MLVDFFEGFFGSDLPATVTFLPAAGLSSFSAVFVVEGGAFAAAGSFFAGADWAPVDGLAAAGFRPFAGLGAGAAFDTGAGRGEASAADVSDGLVFVGFVGFVGFV